MPERIAMNLRLPADLHEALKRIAQEDERSLHNLIIHTLRQLVTQRQKGNTDS